MTPVLKWPGGKRWAAAIIVRAIRDALGEKGTYYEPFLGGGAVFFSLQPKRAILSDVNRELIETYKIIRDYPKQVIDAIRRIEVSEKAFYLMRSSKPETALKRAVRFLYLNRTAFAGMYRVNRRGDFNVPFGGGERTPAVLWQTELLNSASLALKKATLLSTDFEAAVDAAVRGDVIYCDPTYTVAHDNNGFTRYNERNFSWADQERLVAAAENAVRRGSTVLVTNAHHSSLIELYKGWSLTTLHRKTLISPHVKARQNTIESLFILKPRRTPGTVKSLRYANTNYLTYI